MIIIKHVLEQLGNFNPSSFADCWRNRTAMLMKISRVEINLQCVKGFYMGSAFVLY